MPSASLRIAASADNAYEASGNMSLGGTNLRIRTDTQAGGRWQLNIPPGSTINSATLTVKHYNTSVDSMSATLYCEDVDNAAAFTTTANDITNRTLTTASAAWTATDTGAGDIVSPDLSALFQEVIDRAGWAQNNFAAIIGYPVSGASSYSRSYDFDPAQSWLLDISWTEGGGGDVALDGTEGGSSTDSGTLTKDVPLTATEAGASTDSADAALDIALAASEAGSSTDAGELSTAGEVDLSGSEAGTSTDAAAASLDLAMTATEAGGSSDTGTLSTDSDVLLAGSEAGTSGDSGALALLLQVSGSEQGNSADSADIGLILQLSAADAGASDDSGALSASIALNGAESGISGDTGTLYEPDSAVVRRLATVYGPATRATVHGPAQRATVYGA